MASSFSSSKRRGKNKSTIRRRLLAVREVGASGKGSSSLGCAALTSFTLTAAVSSQLHLVSVYYSRIAEWNTDDARILLARRSIPTDGGFKPRLPLD